MLSNEKEECDYSFLTAELGTRTQSCEQLNLALPLVTNSSSRTKTRNYLLKANSIENKALELRRKMIGVFNEKRAKVRHNGNFNNNYRL